MSYFIRVTIIYFILFVGVSIGIERAFVYFHHKDKGHRAIENPISLSDAIAQYNPYNHVRETQSGLLLSATIAQNRQDWTTSWDLFSRLDQKSGEKADADINLKVMSLALVNGDFDKAMDVAKFLEDNKSDAQDDIVKKDQFSSLFLALKNIHQDNFDKAIASLDMIKGGAIYGLTGPVISTWIAAAGGEKIAVPSKRQKLNPLQLYYYALALEYAGDIQSSITMMDRVQITRVPLDKMHHMIAFYHRLKKMDKAMDVAKKSLVMFPKNEILLNALTVLKDNPDEYEPTSYADYHLKGIHAALSMAFHDFAKGLLNEKATDGALLFARMGQYLDPHYDPVVMLIANIFAVHKQYDRAISIYKTITVNEDLRDQAIASQIDIYSKDKDYQSAKKVIDESIKQYPDHAYFYYLAGNIYRDLKRYGQSIDYFNQAEKLGRAQNQGDLPKELWPLFYGRAITYDLDDQWDLAEADLKIAMDKIPNNPLILNYIGYAYADRNIHLDKAKDYISQAVLAAPNDPYITDSMGWILYRLGDYEGALKYLERAAMMRPYHMVINDHLGDVLWQLDRKIEAHYMWKRAATYYDGKDEEQQRMINETYRKLREGL